MKRLGLQRVVQKLRTLGPYLALVLLPGGAVMALLLWLYQRKATLLHQEGA